MFDLFRSRDKMVRFMLGAILVVVSLSMLVYLIPGAGMPSYGTTDQVIAEIGKDKLTVSDVQRRLQEVFRGQQIPPDVVEVYVPTLLESMIGDRAEAYEANRMGFQVSDVELARVIRSMPQVGSLPPDQYRMAIEQMGYSVPEFESNLRKQLLANQLEDTAIHIVVPPKEVEDMYRTANEKMKLSYIAFVPDKLKSGITATPADLQNYYTRMKGTFQVPETRNLALIIADQDKIAASLQIPDAQVQAYYDSHKDQFRTPERVKVRHILLQTTAKSPDEVKKIKAQAEDLLKQIKAGGNFADLAKKYSQDPGSAQNGGDLGWVVRGQTVKNFENTAFSLSPGQTSDVITTEYGFHILQVLEKEQAQLQPFDKVKAQIAADMKKQQVVDKVQQLADQARAELVKAPQNAEQIAAKLGLEYSKADDVRPGAPIPVIGSNKDFDAAVASLKKGEVTPVVQVSQTRLAMAAVEAVNPPRTPALSEIEAQVRAGFEAQRAQEIAREKGEQAANLLKSNGGDLNAVAKSMGAEVKTSDAFTRNGAIEGVGSASYFLNEFNKPVGSVIGPINAAGTVVVGKMIDKIEPDMGLLAKERDSILQQLKQKQAMQRQALFRDSIVTRLMQEGKLKIHRDAISQLVARYRAG